MIRRIEHWSLNRILPSIDDTESLTVLELVGKNTNKINEIVNLVNEHIDTVNTLINDFENETNSDLETFKLQMEQKFKDFTDIIDLKVDSQDKVINESIIYIKEHLDTSIREIINEMQTSGELNEIVIEGLEEVNRRLTVLENKTVGLTYNENTEELNLVGDELDEAVQQVLEGEY